MIRLPFDLLPAAAFPVAAGGEDVKARTVEGASVPETGDSAPVSAASASKAAASFQNELD